jgi:hypothetical protein
MNDYFWIIENQGLPKPLFCSRLKVLRPTSVRFPPELARKKTFCCLLMFMLPFWCKSLNTFWWGLSKIHTPYQKGPQPHSPTKKYLTSATKEEWWHHQWRHCAKTTKERQTQNSFYKKVVKKNLFLKLQNLFCSYVVAFTTGFYETCLFFFKSK